MNDDTGTPTTTKKEKQPQINVQAFCTIRGYSKMMQARLANFLEVTGEKDAEKTIAQWDAVHRKAMNRVS